MSFSWQLEEGVIPTRIKIVGVGGGGCNAVNRMIDQKIRNVDFITVNTDLQSLTHSKAKTRLQIGLEATRGLGAGADPEVGRKAAEEQRSLLQKSLEGADMVFITAGMGGGTGTGATPVIASIAKSLGCLTVAVVTRPFHFEMTARMSQAAKGIESLRKEVDTLIVISNQNLLSTGDIKLSVDQAFEMADRVLMEGVRGVSNLVLQSGFINVDFADVSTIMRNQGNAMMSLAKIGPDEDEKDVLFKILENPLVEGSSIKGANGLLINVCYGKEVLLKEVARIIDLIVDQADPDAKCIQGFTPDETLGKEMHITVIATGFTKKSQNLSNPNFSNQNLSQRDDQVQEDDLQLEEDTVLFQPIRPPKQTGPARVHREKEMPIQSEPDLDEETSSEEKVYTFASDPLLKREKPSGEGRNKDGLEGDVLEKKQNNANKKIIGTGNLNNLDDFEKPAFLRFGKKIDLP